MESFSFDLSILILLWKRWNLERCPFFSGWFTSVKSCCWKKTQRAFKYRRNQGSFPTPEVNRVNCRPLKVGSVHLVFGSSIVDPLQRKPCYVCQPYCSGWGHIKSPKHWQSLRALDHLRLKIASPYPKSTGWRLFSLSKNCPFDGKYTSVQSHFGVPGGALCHHVKVLQWWGVCRSSEPPPIIFRDSPHTNIATLQIRSGRNVLSLWNWPFVKVDSKNSGASWNTVSKKILSLSAIRSMFVPNVSGNVINPLKPPP